MFFWSGKRDSNSRPSRWQRDALPLSYSRTRTTDDNQRKQVFKPDMFSIVKNYDLVKEYNVSKQW